MTSYGQFASPGCCCLQGCTIYGDLFTTDTIGTNWDELAGAWSIAGDILSTDDAAGLLIATQVHPDGAGSPHVVRVDVRFHQALDVARVIAAYEDADNYLFAELWVGEDGCGHIRAYERIGGTDSPASDEFTIPFDLPLDAWHTVTLCYLPGTYPSPDTLGLRVRSAAGNIWRRTADVTPALPGDRAGLGTGTPVDNTIDFDGFEFLYHYDVDVRPNCPRCDADTNCTLHTDDFARADSADAGCAWEAVTEVWSIDGEELTVAAADAILRNRTPLPDDNAHVQISFTFRAEAGAILLVLLDYVDADNFVFVQLEPGSHGECGRVSFWRRTAGVDAQLGSSSLLLGMSAATDEIHTLTICWQDELLSTTLVAAAAVEYSGGSHSVYGVEQLATEPYVGLGTGGSASQIWIDSFLLKRLRDADHPTCPECGSPSCVLYSRDPREGADGSDTTLNCLWNEIAGTWTVNTATGNVPSIFLAVAGALTELFEISDSDALLINETGHPGTTAEGHLDLTSGASVQLVTFNYGNVARLLIGLQDDDNYLFAEVEWSADDATTGYLRVGKVVAGVRTVIDETETGITAGQPHVDSDSANQSASTLCVSYDGYEIRANFANNSLASFFDSELIFAAGVAGTGWNPGRSGLATGTITGSVWFGRFAYYHDIFGANINCQPCSNGSTCGICGELNEDDEWLDRTPPIVLVEISGLTPDTVGGCADGEQFNDTFAAPFFEYQTSGGIACYWKLQPHFCDHGNAPFASDFTYVQFSIATSAPNYTFRVDILAHIPGAPSNPWGLATVTWLRDIAFVDIPSYEATGTGTGDGQGFNCLAFLDDWVTISSDPLPTYPFNTSNWLSNYPGTAATRVKVLA